MKGFGIEVENDFDSGSQQGKDNLAVFLVFPTRFPGVQDRAANPEIFRFKD